MKFNLTAEKMTHLALALFAAYATMLLPMDALAVSGGGGISASGAVPTALSDVLCNVVGWFNGPVGAGIATLAIIVIGIGALMGKVSWGMAIIVGLGVGVIFGADTIVSALGAGETC
jgi:type IV secretory pathway VirB2 component (pilin)